MAVDGQFYLFHKEKTSWKEAQSICQSEIRGGGLAVIDSEKSFASAKEFHDKHHEYMWLGGSDERSEGDWYWVNQFQSVQYLKDTGMVRWNPHEPHAWNGLNENCLGHVGNGWFDSNCGNSLAFLCQLPRKSKFGWSTFHNGDHSGSEKSGILLTKFHIPKN